MSGQRLTPHQKEVHDRLVGLSHRGTRWVAERYIGSRGALNKLIVKGRAEMRTEYGPRGGELRSYRSLPEAADGGQTP